MSSIERDLAAYYDAEGVNRAERALAPGRVEARAGFLATHTRAGQRCLEIGSGPGRDAEAFVAAGLEAVAIDLSTVFASLAASTGALVANASARALPFVDASFDVVWSMSVLMHLPDDVITTALDEIRRVLGPGGVACIGVWGGADLTSILPGPFGDRLFVRRSRATWQPMLGRVGEVVQYDEWEPENDQFAYHWAVIRRTI